MRQIDVLNMATEELITPRTYLASYVMAIGKWEYV